MCVSPTRSRGFVLNPAARIIVSLRQKKYGPLRMPQLFRPWRVRKLSFVSWESWQTGMARIALIERSVSVRQDVRQNVMSLTALQITIMKCDSCEYFKRWLSEASPAFSGPLPPADTNVCARSHLPSLPTGSLLAFVTLCAG